MLYTADEEELSNYFGKNPGAPHFLTLIWDVKLLRLLQGARSTSAAHLKGERFQKVRAELRLDEQAVSDVFRGLLAGVNGMLDDLQAYFVPNSEGPMSI